MTSEDIKEFVKYILDRDFYYTGQNWDDFGYVVEYRWRSENLQSSINVYVYYLLNTNEYEIEIENTVISEDYTKQEIYSILKNVVTAMDLIDILLLGV